MPLSGAELLSDLPQLLVLAQKAQAAVAALPKPPAKAGAEDYAKALAGLLPDLGAFVDELIAQAAS